MSKQETPATPDTNLFNKNFLGRLKKVLDTKCVGGVAVNREQLCQEMGLDPKMFQGTISALIHSGAVEGYEVKRGNYGGIGKVGEARKLPEGVKISRPRKSEQFDPGFLKLVQETLVKLTSEHPEAFVRRLDVAKAMGMPGSDTENAISLAINSGKIPGYESKRGAGGGIRRATPGGTPKVEKAEEVPVSQRPEIFKSREKKEKKAA